MSEQATDLWPGMLVIQLTSYVRKQLNLSRKTGRLIIALVEKGSPAYTAGLIEGDVISSIDGNQVRDLLEFYTQEVYRLKDVRAVETFVVYKGYNLKVPYIL